MSFDVSGDAYDRFMGRYSRVLAPVFADFAGIGARQRVVDVGCGSGVLTEELARRVGAENVAGADPSPMLAAAAERVPGADLRTAAAESLPWPDDSFDAALAQLVVHFMADSAQGVREMARVTRPGGVVAACTWDFAHGGMELLGTYWQTVRSLVPDADAERSPLGDYDNLERLWRGGDLADVDGGPLDVEARYRDFDELWESFRGGVGPAGQYLLSLAPATQDAVRDEYRRRLGDPDGPFSLTARAWAVRGRVSG